jgi:hypothetical protein
MGKKGDRKLENGEWRMEAGNRRPETGGRKKRKEYGNRLEVGGRGKSRADARTTTFNKG